DAAGMGTLVHAAARARRWKQAARLALHHYTSKMGRAGTPAVAAAAAACEALAVIAMVHRRVAGASGCQNSLAFGSCLELLVGHWSAACMLCEPSSLLLFPGGGGILAA
ncbi:unnamed protein product, partial [Symbiodinium sp. CCMP2456]